MHDWILRLFVVSMLFVSVEGFGEPVDDASFHQTHHAHADDANGDWFPDTDGDDHSGSSCEHFCHLHSVGLIDQYSLAALDGLQSYEKIPALQRVARVEAPPTPPPNI